MIFQVTLKNGEDGCKGSRTVLVVADYSGAAEIKGEEIAIYLNDLDDKANWWAVEDSAKAPRESTVNNASICPINLLLDCEYEMGTTKLFEASTIRGKVRDYLRNIGIEPSTFPRKPR